MTDSKQSAGRKWFIRWMSQKEALTFESRHYKLYGDSLPEKTWDSFGRTTHGSRKRKFYEDVAATDKLNASNRCECALTVWPFSLPYNGEVQGRGDFIRKRNFEQFLKPWSRIDGRPWYYIRCPNTNDGGSKFCRDCRHGVDHHVRCWEETYLDLLQSAKS